MKIKKALILLLAVTTCFTAFAQTKAKTKTTTKPKAKVAQAPAFKCEPAFALLEEKAKDKSYDDVVKQLPDLMKHCPKFNEQLYVYGETAFKDKEVKTKDEAEKKKFVQDRIALYDAWQKNYPASGADIKRALLLNEKSLAKEGEVYKLLNDAFNANPQLFMDYTALELYFNLYLKEYEAAKGITQDEFIRKVGDIAAQIAFAKNTIEDKRAVLHKKRDDNSLVLEQEELAYLSDTRTLSGTFDAVAENMFRAASKYFSCEKLETYYSANFEKNKGNVAWIDSMVHVLTFNKCNRSDVLYNGAVVLNELRPGYKSALQLGYLSQKRNKTDEAIAYYEQAVALQEDSVQKANLYNDIAAIYRVTDRAKAKEFALKSAAVNPNSGKPYLFIAGLYASPPKDCGLGDFEVKALKLLAIETLKKAELAEPKYKPTVASLTEEYTKGLPTKKEAKAVKKGKGDIITYGCWINESVTLPKLK
ncbi:hypothetical protein GR160_13385 [Flavobacterium sp. Sd200]|uniref:tetratricopeptide repeat protein n=1 Tax=Flavobacterium sp. Sd200 TaxID=2692211 RepID=UPI00136E16F6|nr:hypothetical protein [Flavobacterium sp. Sd200]MXN92216.1 hypothetical protein [Flavobacterium sp. Sd200]